MIAFANVTACGSDWFGNEDNPPLNKCALSEMKQKPVPNDIPTPFASIEIVIRAIRFMSNGSCDNNWTVPVSLHVYATAEGFSAIKMPDGSPLPWDGIRISPWSATFYLTTLDGSPPPPNPRIKIDFVVKHIADHPDNIVTKDRVALGCLIRVNGGTINNDLQGNMKVGQLLRCQADFTLP